MTHLRFALLAVGTALALFVAMIVVFEGGRRIGRRRRERLGDQAPSGKIDVAVYGLLSLLIGFAFSGAAGRFDHRREIVREEVTAIDAAWLRIQTLPPEQQPAVRDGFRRYLDALIRSYRVSSADEEARRRAETLRIRNEVWGQAVAAAIDPSGEKARMLLLPSLNEMFDAVETEWLARRMHPPPVIFILLGAMALIGAFFLGVGMSEAESRNWSFIVGVAGAIALAMYVIIELEYPRMGLVRVDPFDRALVELRETMGRE